MQAEWAGQQVTMSTWTSKLAEAPFRLVDRVGVRKRCIRASKAADGRPTNIAACRWTREVFRRVHLSYRNVCGGIEPSKVVNRGRRAAECTVEWRTSQYTQAGRICRQSWW